MISLERGLHAQLVHHRNRSILQVHGGRAHAHHGLHRVMDLAQRDARGAHLVDLGSGFDLYSHVGVKEQGVVSEG